MPGSSSFALSLPARSRNDSCAAKLLRTLTARRRRRARLLPFFHHYAGAKAESKASWNGRESFEKAAPYPWFAKTQFTHSQRLTAVMASERSSRPCPAIPPGPRPAHRQQVVQHRDHREQPKQAGRQPQHGCLFPSARRLQSQVSTHFLEGSLNRPTTGVRLDHRGRDHLRIGAEEVIIAMCPGPIADEDQGGAGPTPRG